MNIQHNWEKKCTAFIVKASLQRNGKPRSNQKLGSSALLMHKTGTLRILRNPEPISGKSQQRAKIVKKLECSKNKCGIICVMASQTWETGAIALSKPLDSYLQKHMWNSSNIYPSITKAYSKYLHFLGSWGFPEMQEVSSTNRMNSRRRKMHPRPEFVVVSNE